MSSNLGFCNKFSKTKPCLAPHLILSVRSMCICPHQGIRLPFFILLLMMAICGAQGRIKDKAYLHHIYCKVKDRIQGEKQFIQSDQNMHMYGCDGYGKVDTRPGMGARYYHTCMMNVG